MKKWKRALLTGLSVCAAMLVTASASSFDSTADTLKTMGLFAGTNTGYELDRAPTRAEAATMLVRLLGKTDEAESLWASDPSGFAFQDMESFDWAKPYVHWLSRNQLAAGTSAMRFSPAEPCTAQMYAAFLMRTLGYYETNGDFTFADAIPFARSQGVLNDANCDTEKFLRDHVVAASYTALSAKPKSGEADLLTRLVGEGAVSAAAASAEQQKFAVYRGYAAAVQTVSDGAALENIISLSVSGGVSMELAAVSKTRLRSDRLSTEGSLTMTVPGEDPFVLEHRCYYADGRLYTEENGSKTWKKATMDAVLRELSQPGAVPLVLLDGITETDTGYRLTYSPAGRERYLTDLRLLESALGGSVLGFRDLSIGELSAEVNSSGGRLDSLSSGVTVSGRMNNRATGGEAEVTIRARQTSKVTESGSGVQVNAPTDLSAYQQDES